MINSFLFFINGFSYTCVLSKPFSGDLVLLNDKIYYSHKSSLEDHYIILTTSDPKLDLSSSKTLAIHQSDFINEDSKEMYSYLANIIWR